MSPDDAYEILKAIAEIHRFSERLTKIPPTQSDEEAEATADEIAKVISNKTVEYQNKEYSLTALAQKLTHSQYNLAGPRFFKYKGELLNEIRKRVESEV